MPAMSKSTSPAARIPTERYRVAPGRFDLARYDPDDDGGLDKSAAGPRIEQLNDALETLQERLWANQRHRLLVVLQGMDTSGKDGVIRQVFDGVNPIGVRVASFKAPTAEELARDFLWRVHSRVPAAGEIVIFNRSHYEDVLVARVRELVPKSVWSRRYRQIVDFERLLAETGTTIVKLFLHISKSEQKARLEARVADPEKRWKFNPADLEERRRWRAYQAAYAEALRRTSVPAAPWYVVPANRKWYRNLVIAGVIVDTLRALDLEPAPPKFDPATIVVR